MFKPIVISLFIFIGHSYEREVNSILLSKANNNFGLKFLQLLNDDNKNVFFSPFSISTAFGILYSGANGQTAEELREGLGYNSAELSDKQMCEQFSQVLEGMTDKIETKTKNYGLILANRIIAQKDSEIMENFKHIIQKYFRSDIEVMDFSNNPMAITKNINDWISKHTKHKIKDILKKPLDPMTRMVILNAIYFKGVFHRKFDKQLTREEVFFNGGETETLKQMMRRTGKFNYTEIDEIDSQLLEIPYSGDEISLYIVLPKERQGLRKFRQYLEDFSIIENVEESINNLYEQELHVVIPKFKIETTYALNKELPELGIKTVFTKRADLSPINGRKNLYVSEAIHKAYVEVNEEGTEAAAASAIRIQAKSMPLRTPQFRADHPFLFLIRNNKNGLILFFGLLNKL